MNAHGKLPGVLEVVDEEGAVRAARHVFGAEPTGPELLAYARRGFAELLERAYAAPPVADGARGRVRPVSPKRLARAGRGAEGREG